MDNKLPAGPEIYLPLKNASLVSWKQTFLEKNIRRFADTLLLLVVVACVPALGPVIKPEASLGLSFKVPSTDFIRD